MLQHRFGQINEPREAVRRFDMHRQQETESVVKFGQALRVLHRVAFPTMTAVECDAMLKRRFEDDFYSPEMIQFIRLHAVHDSFTVTLHETLPNCGASLFERYHQFELTCLCIFYVDQEGMSLLHLNVSILDLRLHH